MRPGLIGGFLAGTALSVAVLGVVSELVPGVTLTPPQATAPAVPAGSAFREPREDRAATLPAADTTPAPEPAPRVPLPERDDTAPLESADTTPAARPRTGRPEALPEAPRTRDGDAGVVIGGDEPVLPSPQALAPVEPAPEPGPEGDAAGARIGDESAISVEPVQPAPPPAEEESGMPPTAQGTVGTVPDAQPEAAAPAPEPAPAPAPAVVPAPEPAVAPAPEPSPAPEPAGESAALSRTESATDTATRLAPSGTIGDLAEGVTTGRLPSVTDEPAADTAPGSGAGMPALSRNAAPFSNPDGRPLMAIVLIDDGQSPVSFEALSDFPYPVSYAIDASRPDAGEVAARYRAAGLEVLAMVDLPEGATARDAEVAMQTHLAAIPDAVAVMEGIGTGLQSSREAALQLIPILRDSGHGLVLFSEGLDTARKLIAREGVPVAPVFRDFDGQGQNARAMRRFLDQAAFKAGQEEGGVVMVGRLRAETVSALLLWGLQDRATSVALAPVSAVLGAGIE